MLSHLKTEYVDQRRPVARLLEPPYHSSLASRLTGFVVLVIGIGYSGFADAADPPAHVLRKANAGSLSDVLIVQPGAAKATGTEKQAQRPAVGVAQEQSTASQTSSFLLEIQPGITKSEAHPEHFAVNSSPQTPAASQSSTFVLEIRPGIKKPAVKAVEDASTDVAVRRQDVHDEQAVHVSQQPGTQQQAGGTSPVTVTAEPQLFRWQVAEPTADTAQRPRTVHMPTAERNRQIASQSQRRPNDSTDEAPSLLVLGPLETIHEDRNVAVRPVQAEVNTAQSTTGAIAQAEASDRHPTPAEEYVPEIEVEGSMIVEGEFIEEPGPYVDGNCQSNCPSYATHNNWSIPWEVFAQGEYIGPARTPHVPEYRLRVDDQIEFIYRLDGKKSSSAYRINVGDNLQIESLTAENLNREVLVQPDGTISLRQLGQVPAAGRTVDELRDDLDERYAEFVQKPTMSVIPLTVNTTLEELRATVDNRFGSGGQSRLVRVTPEGTVQLPAIGSIRVQGLTLDEVGFEAELRYASIVDGLEVTPVLSQRAPRYVYVVGEVAAPGRYTLEAPTSLMQAIALAGGWNVGGNLYEVVVFRRDENWRLLACRINIRAPLYGKELCPQQDIWLRDSDIVVVPKCKILVADEFIELVFTRGIYGVFPFGANVSFFRDLSTVSGIPVIPAVP